MRKLVFVLLLVALPLGASNIGTTDPHLEVCRGLSGNDYCVNKFGFNTDVDAGQEVISTTAAYWQPTSASTIEIVSGDPDDTAAGTGCQNICIQGVDASVDVVTECEDTAGASASTATTTSFFRVFRAWCDRTGTYGGNNEGLITMRISSGGATVAQIEADIGQTEIAAYTIPAGFTCYGITYQMASDEASSAVEGLFFGFFNIDDVSTPFGGAKRLFERSANLVSRVSTMPFTVPEKTDMTCNAQAGSNSDVSCTFSLLCLEN